MIRTCEGTTRLQGIGIVEGIKAKNIKVGDELVWNYGGTSKVVAIEFSKTGKTLIVTTEYNGELYERRMTAERIVVVKELNPVEEAEEIKEATEKAEQPKKKIGQYEKWIRTFIEEKGLDIDLEFTIEHNNTTHFITLGFIIDLIVKAQKQEQEQIKNKIVYIDFRNGDVIHFFEFLANAYIKTNY